jgi:hypothetical protein
MEKYYELNMIRVRRGHWESKENHKLFGISLGKELKYETMEDLLVFITFIFSGFFL